MTARGDIRHYFEQEAAAYPVPSGLRASVAAEARRGVKAEHPGMRLAAVVAAALAVAIVAGLVAAGSLRPKNPPVPVVRPGQHGLVLDADLDGGSTGWALLGACPGNDPTSQCAYWVETTRDGGRTWLQPVKIVTAPFTNGDTPRHVRFTDSRNGFVYGNGMAFATHDGGATWRRIFASASGIVDIQGRGVAWAVIYPCAKGTQCAYVVERSTDGGRSWARTSDLPQGFSPRFAVPFGSEGLVLTSYGVGDLAITRDGGRSWSVIPGRCAAETTENEVATADGNELWQFCGPRPILSISEDGGQTWSERSLPDNYTVGADIISPVAGTAFLITSTDAAVTSNVEVSRDRGLTWAIVPGTHDFVALSFSSDAAWAIDAQFGIWSSNDGGLTWTKLPGQP